MSVGGNADHSLLVGEQVMENFSVAGRRGEVTWLVRERSAPGRWVIDGTGKDGGRATITYTLTRIPTGQISNVNLSTPCRMPSWQSWIG